MQSFAGKMLMEAALHRIARPQPIDELGSQRLTLFALAWGMQTLLEMGKWGEMFANPLQFLVFASAGLVCLRSKRTGHRSGMPDLPPCSAPNC